MGINTATVQSLYLAYFGRPADPVGATYWEGQLAAGKTLGTIVNAGFSPSAEYTGNTTGQPVVTTVNNLYLNLFGRAAEIDGLLYWAGKVQDGSITIGNLAVQLTASASTADKLVLNNKVAAATAFTAAINTVAEVIGYNGTAAFASAKTWLAGVTTTASLTAATATAALDTATAAAVASAPPANPGSTFSLTTGLDNIPGTSGDDIIGGTDTTLTAIDAINGGLGTDTLKIGLAAAYAGGATITGVEKIIATQSGAFNFNASGITGLTTVGDNGGSVGATVFTALANVVNLEVSNTGQNFGATFADTVLAGTSDTVAVAVNNVTGAAAITLTQATAAANSVETVAITANTAASSITLVADATETSLTKVTVAGSANLTAVLSTGVTTTALTVDASAATGILTLSGMGAVNNTITGGSGNDVISFAGNFNLNDVLNGGAGTDTLSANGAQLAAIVLADANVSNVETLMLADDVANTATTVSSGLFGSSATVSNVRISDQGTAGVAAVVFNSLAAAATGATNNFRFDGDIGATGGSFTFNITNATNGGTANAETLDLRGVAFTATSSIVTAGVETTTIDTTNATAAHAFTFTDAALTTLTVKGGQSVNLSSAALGTVVGSVDATGLTGTAALTATLSASAVSGVTVNVTNAGANVIIASNLADNITAGTGANVITGKAGADTITFGSHASGTIDTIKQSATAETYSAATAATIVSGTTVLTGIDVVTGLKAADVIDLTGILTTYTGAAGTTIASASGTTVALVKGNFATATSIWTTSASGTDTLFVYDADGGGSATAVEAIALIGSAVVGTAAAGVLTLA